MNLKHVKNGIQNGVATILIYDQIGQTFNENTGRFDGISGVEVAREIQMLNDIPEVDQINVRINSSGGSVVEGYSIFSAIKNSTKKTKTYIDGIGASISGIIFQAGDERNIVDFGRLMIHDPSIANNRLLTPKQQTMLKSFRDSLMTILSNNSKVDDNEIDNIMTAETWLNPTDAQNKGFADNVINTNRSEISNNLSIEEIQNIANENIKNIHQTSNKMKDLKNHLNLNDDATETDVIKHVQTMENKVTEIENSNNTLKTENETLKTTISDVENKVTTLSTEKSELVEKIATIHVENAIEKGLFTADNKSELIKQAKNDIDGFLSIVKAMKTTPKKITNFIDSGNNGDGVQSLRNLEKTNPKEVQRLMNEEPETFKAMYKSEYGVEPNL